MAVKHPSLNESLILICAAMVFTVEHWDEYVAMTEMDTEDKEAVEEIKNIYFHLIDDMHSHIEQVEMLEMMQHFVSISKTFISGT